MRHIAILFTLLAAVLSYTAPAADASERKACQVPAGDPGIREEEKQSWTACEKWVWSCIVRGQEANLYEQRCLEPRSAESNDARQAHRFQPFFNPDDPPVDNELSDQFLRTILWRPEYAGKIHPHGVRIYGAYFKGPVNLENITTTSNLVIDGSVFKDGLRMTNFRTEKNVSFDGSNVRGSLLLLRARIEGSLFIGKGVYDEIDLRDARIGASIDAANSVFNDDFRMHRARIEGKVHLVKSRLTALNAWDTVIGGSLELRLADLRARMDLTGTSVNGDVRIQQMRFGRARDEAARPSCEWDTSGEGDDVLSELLTKAGSDTAAVERVMDEVVRSRPALSPTRHRDICIDVLQISRPRASHEALLRDMKIKGTLCLIDITGEIASTSPVTKNIASVSLDGSQANSTVLRWQPSHSDTLWRAVNFRTNYMLVNLESQPRRHFIDNIDVGFIAFLKTDPLEKGTADEIATRSENLEKYLCDVTPTQRNLVPANSREAHERLVAFFTSDRNKSGSAQPFSKIVERLDESSATSTYLKTKLSEYRLQKVCTTSVFSQELGKPGAWSWAALPQSLSRMRENMRKKGQIKETSDYLGESNRLLWDGVCSVGMMVYRHAVSYGHEPYNLFYYAILLVGIFWLLLRFDTPAREGANGGRKLGLTYAIDTFVPLAQLRSNQANVDRRPNRPLLRLYLRFHRFAGFIFAVLVFLFIYRAAR